MINFRNTIIVSLILINTFIVKMSCYTKTKIDLSKLGNKYEISGTWLRSDDHSQPEKGLRDPHPLRYSLTFYDNDTYEYKCNEKKSVGRFKVSEDTVIFTDSKNIQARYIYELSGKIIRFTKLDHNNISSCIAGFGRDSIEGSWSYR